MLWERSRLYRVRSPRYTRFVKERHGTLDHLIEQDSFNVFASLARYTTWDYYNDGRTVLKRLQARLSTE